MLKRLNIKNVAVIDEAEIEFSDGLNILTGETGAGKSIIIDSINMIMGERGGRALVRNGEKSAVIQAEFESASPKVLKIAEECGAETDGEIILSRKIGENGKSSCRINSYLVNSSALAKIGTEIVDIHGQHDNQKLLSQAFHMDFLDSFSDEIQSAKERYTEAYEKYVSAKKRLEFLENNEAQRLERIEFLSFRTDEIKKAELREGEEEELLAEERLLSNAEDIIRSLSEVYSVLYEGEFTAYDALGIASKKLSDAADMDDDIKESAASLTDILYSVGDIASQVRERRDGLDFDPARLEEVQERLALISSLKRKYGESIEKILENYEKMCIELDELTGSGQSAEEIKRQLDEFEKELSQRAKDLSCKRKAAGVKLESAVEKELCELDMEKVRFAVSIEPCGYNSSGADRVEFLICTNPGEPKKPLIRIASGGELSRIMLALKTVLSDADGAETLIFDEIDTGVSGRAAGKIAAKLMKIAKKKQVICITHLAQIACAADSHYLIKKDVGENASSTHIRLLDHEGRLEELSRIIGSINVSETARVHAENILEDAEKMKKTL